MTVMDAPTSMVGDGILNLVTTGMHPDPLAIYREYVQNSADAISAAKLGEHGRVEINVDPSGMRVRIRDNGPGLSEEGALAALLPIAHSLKRRGTDRGFRGIGRLSGLAFAETVSFLTRARRGAPLSRIVWNGPKLRERILETRQIERAIRDCVTMETISGNGYPDHFFEVEVADIGRHAAGSILNREYVRAYIAEVCPVPVSRSFPFAAEVDGLLCESVAPLTLDIVLDGETEPVMRPYHGAIRYSDLRVGKFSELEEIRIPAVDRDGTAALGWIAHSSYLGAIPKDARIRGIRAREGNIQIGGETVFDGLFPEERFNRWCVGEIHILDPRIVPNGRRDYFEPSPHTRNFENHLATALHHVAVRCRKASAMRNSERKIHSAIRRIEEAYELAASGYLAAADAKAIIANASSGIPAIRHRLDMAGEHVDWGLQDLRELEQKLRNFRARRGRPPFRGMSKLEIETCRKVFRALTQATESPRVAKETIEAVLARA